MEPTPKTMETEPTPYLLLEHAIGTIEAGPDQQERLEEFTNDLAAGNFHVHTDKKIPCGCIDGRDSREGIKPKPDSAGGSETMFVADDLTTKRFAGPNGTTFEAYANTLAHLDGLGIEVGGHNDDHAAGEASGCGANDKLPAIYEFIAQNGDMLRDLAASLGIKISDDDFASIIANATSRSQFSSGKEMLSALEQYGDDKVDPLVGSHREVVAVINTVEATTLDRVALKAKYGDTYQAFNVDTWTFKHSAEAISKDPSEIDAKVFAMAAYNLATAHVLCGKKMRVLVR